MLQGKILTPCQHVLCRQQHWLCLGAGWTCRAVGPGLLGHGLPCGKIPRRFVHTGKCGSAESSGRFTDFPRVSRKHSDSAGMSAWALRPPEKCFLAIMLYFLTEGTPDLQGQLTCHFYILIRKVQAASGTTALLLKPLASSFVTVVMHLDLESPSIFLGHHWIFWKSYIT